MLHFLMGLHQEVGRHPVSAEKATRNIGIAIREGAVFNVLLDDGTDEIVGSLALLIADSWYADAQLFVDRWLFIAPHHRDGGVVMRILLAEARALADETGQEILIIVDNPRPRMRHPSRLSQIERCAVALRFRPTGRTVSIAPKRHG